MVQAHRGGAEPRESAMDWVCPWWTCAGERVEGDFLASLRLCGADGLAYLTVIETGIISGGPGSGVEGKARE